MCDRCVHDPRSHPHPGPQEVLRSPLQWPASVEHLRVLVSAGDGLYYRSVPHGFYPRATSHRAIVSAQGTLVLEQDKHWLMSEWSAFLHQSSHASHKSATPSTN